MTDVLDKKAVDSSNINDMANELIEKLGIPVKVEIDKSSDEFKKKAFEAGEKILTSRVALLLKHTFFGNIATRMRMIEASERIETMATDGYVIYYNVDFVCGINNRNAEFVICHELLHVLLEHFGRTGTRNRRVANYAQDYAINQILVDENIGEMPGGKGSGLQDDKYRGMSWEEIYDELIKSHKTTKMTMDEYLDSLGSLIDEHLDSNMSEEDKQKLKDHVRNLMLSSAQATGAGRIPAGIARIIKALSEPKMDWRQVLRMQLQSILRDDYTFARPSRKGWHTNVILPGMKQQETIDVCIAFDMSGSIGDDDSLKFLSEVNAMINQFSNAKVSLWCFDTAVYNFQEYGMDTINGPDITTYQLKGGGGTDFKVNWDFMKENNIRPKKFIFFTDGENCDSKWCAPGDEEYCDTIFLIYNNHKIQAPFGETIYFENN